MMFTDTGNCLIHLSATDASPFPRLVWAYRKASGPTERGRRSANVIHKRTRA